MRWLCNAPPPGSFLQHRGIVKSGEVFETPDDEKDPLWERPRAFWIPQDAAAKAAVAKWNKEHPQSKFITRRFNYQNLPPGHELTIEAGAGAGKKE